ncbi:MAG: ADP-ribosylation factor-like protein [Candidatus Helarchaeota archaeon]
MDEVLKVVFLGIDNAGKTTILNILTKQYSHLEQISPTKAITRKSTELFGFQIVNWDVPGQERYREQAFKDTHLFRNADVLIFVIDVQDLRRTALSIAFYEKVLKKLEENLESPYISVFIHKLDPDIQNESAIIANVKAIQKEITGISTGFDVEFFLTTKYLQATLLIGFSNTVIKVFAQRKRHEVLKQTVAEISEQLDLDSLTILDKNFFIIYNYERTPNTLSMLQDFAYSLLSNYDNAKTYHLALDEIRLSLKEYTFIIVPFVSDLDIIYIVTVSNDPELSLKSVKSRLFKAFNDVIRWPAQLDSP